MSDAPDFVDADVDDPDDFDPNACPDCSHELDCDADSLAWCPRCGWMEPDDDEDEEF